MVAAGVLAALAFTGVAQGGIDRAAANVHARVECPDTRTFTAEVNRYVGDFNHSGLYVFDDHRIILSPLICAEITQLEDGYLPHGDAANEESGFAVFVFAHELQHAAGVVDEDAADCGAERTFLDVAAQVGASPVSARRMLIASAPVDGYHAALAVTCAPRLMSNVD